MTTPENRARAVHARALRQLDIAQARAVHALDALRHAARVEAQAAMTVAYLIVKREEASTITPKELS